VPLALARAVAEEARARLAPACVRLEIAGSIRRGRPDVADVELVAVPRVTPGRPDLFGAPTTATGELHALATELLAAGVLAHRPDKNGRPAFGEKLKRVVFTGAAGVLPLDLFAVTPPAQWGVIFTVRTGPGAFSTRLVTARRYGGGMPEGHRVRDGAL
jgi:DNA polymerase/3'-5' exonuclease PolX